MKSNYYLDTFCIATAISNNLTIVTGDPDFKKVDELILIEWLP